MQRPDTYGSTAAKIAFENDVEADTAATVQSSVDARLKADVVTGRDNYKLSTALAIIRQMETSSSRSAIFAEIKSKNLVYRIVDMLYCQAGSRVVQPLVLLAYMLKCVLSIGTFDYEDQEAVAISNFHNEYNAIIRLTSLLPGVHIMHLSLRRGHIFKCSQLRIALSMISTATRVFPFLSRLARSYGFMPAARIASGLAYYIRFSLLFSQHPKLGTAFIASNYSPEALGLAAAAHSMDRKVVYINHAPVPANGPMVPPVLADCAVFYGDAAQRTYEKASRCNADVALIGQTGTIRPMKWSNELREIGIFLTALTCVEAVEKLVSAINNSHPDVQILIRNHPVTLLKSDFSDLVANHNNVKITNGTPLDDEIEACDLIFCGNSGVAMNALRGGKPVAYLDALDDLNHDYCGFAQDGLVYEVKNWSNDLYPMLKAFYTGPAWRRVMQSYDASYNSDTTMLEQKAAQKILRHLGFTHDIG